MFAGASESADGIVEKIMGMPDVLKIRYPESGCERLLESGKTKKVQSPRRDFFQL